MAEPAGATHDPPRRRSFGSRLVGAVLLDGGTYQEIENDRSALVSAAAIVALAGLARGIGTPSASPAFEILGSGIAGLMIWLLAGLLIWGTGVKRMGYTSSYLELLRTIGFASAPLLLLFLRALPLGAAAQPVWWVAHAWSLLALVIAMREALDVSLFRASVVCLLCIATAVAVVAGLAAVLFVPRPLS